MTPLASLETLFFQTFQSQQAWTMLALAFVGGVVSSLLPCTLAMMPILIGYIGGYGASSKWLVLRQTGMFILGVAIVMSVLGVAAGFLGLTFGAWIGRELYTVIGILGIVMGLQILGIFKLQLPNLFHKLPAFATESGHWLAPLALGMAFGAASSPCGTPYLTAILSLISHQKSWFLGGTCLFLYAVGQGVLLLLVGLFTGLLRYQAALHHVGRVVNTVSGVVFILAGLLFGLQGLGFWDPLRLFLFGGA